MACRNRWKECKYDCETCENYIPGYITIDVCSDALAYIRQREREMEAMVRDMKAWPACDACKHRNLLCTQKPCSECREAGNGKTVKWEWRGVEEDNHAED